METTLNTRRETLHLLCRSMCAMVIFCAGYAVAYHNLFALGGSDLSAHLHSAMELDLPAIVKGLLTGSDILWHSAVRAISALPGMDARNAACLVTGAAQAAYYVLACWLIDRELPDLPAAAAPLAALGLCVAAALHAPWYSRKFYLGIGSPSIWHSPTQISVEPFALLVTAMTVLLYCRLREPEGQCARRVFRTRREAALYALLLAMSVMAKPSFFQIMVPGLGLLMVVDLIATKGASFLFSFKLACAFIPAAALTAMKYFTAFYVDEGSGGVEIAPFEYWHHYTRSIPFAMLLLLAFPLLVFVMDRRRWRDVEYRLSLALLLAGAGMKATLIEGGHRRWHGNFAWGYELAATLVWFAAVKRFLALLRQKDLPRRERLITVCVGGSLLALHILFGVYKIFTLVTGDSQY